MSENVDELVCRLEATMTDIKSVMETCQAPSISLGVLHHGRVVFRSSIGLRDVEAGLKADSDTSYLLGSCSKLFTSTALGMLVDDKVSWDDPISKHLPDFNPIQDPSIRTEATIVDIARHSSGLANPNAVFLGPGGFTTVKGEDHIAMVNNLPTSNSSGQRFNSWWYYSNAAFGLVAEIIPRVSGVSFATFLREQLCQPLGLSQTLVTEADLKENKNVAHPYVRRDGGDWTRIHNECTSEAHGAVLASLGIRTSVNDMLAFCAGVMNRYDEEEGKVPVQDLLPQSASNPLRNISSMWNWWWGRPCEDGFENDSAYTLGWFRTTMPTSALGTLSYNTVRRIEDIIGKESAPRTVYGHNGCVNGSVATAYVIPESHSAVVVFANAADAGDAAETSSQILLQALFDLKPKVDLMPSLNASVAERRQMHDDMIKEWEAHRDAARFSCPPEELQGTYVGLGVSRIHIVPAEESPSGLAVVFGTQQASRCDLEPYNVDALSFLPLKHDDKLARAMIDWDYWTVGVLAFVRDVVKDEGDVAHHDGAVSGLRWQWDEYDYPGLWVKIKDGMSDEDIEAVFEKHGRFQDIPEFQQRFSAEARLDKDTAGAKEGAGVSSSL